MTHPRTKTECLRAEDGQVLINSYEWVTPQMAAERLAKLLADVEGGCDVDAITFYQRVVASRQSAWMAVGSSIGGNTKMLLEATRLTDCWAIRPLNRLGTCGWVAGGQYWQVRFVKHLPGTGKVC